MKHLSDILEGVAVEQFMGNQDLMISSVEFDSREVEDGCCFIAVRGTRVNGHRFIQDAIRNGANAIVCEELPEPISEGITYIRVTSSSRTLGEMACNFFEKPAEKLKLIGITGTNGKTTTANLVYQSLRKQDKNAGLISTIGNFIGDQEFETTHTTPDAIMLNSLLHRMVEEKCEYAVMEVSSHAISQNRIAGLTFYVAVFTNLTHDHLDYHGNFDEYLAAKKKLFDGLERKSIALYNLDDKHGKIVVQNCPAGLKSFGLHTLADFKGKVIESHFNGMQMRIDQTEVWTRFTGEFNAYNLLACYATCRILGFENSKSLQILSDLLPVPGRFEIITSDNGVIAVVDYAHTPDALENILGTINKIRKKHQQVITVVGAGGDRDKTKRPVMGSVAATASDKLILTSDNPRNENPNDIIQDMLEGIQKNQRKKVVSIQDRKEAIRMASLLARREDIILIAGKGHETYQEIKGIKYQFDDREVIRELFETTD